MSYRSRLFAGLSAALVVAACGEIPTPPPAPPPPGSYTLTLLSPTLSIVQGGETNVNITLGRTNFTGNVTLGVDIGDGHGTMPPGLAAAGWVPNPVAGDSSVLTLTASAAAVPGVYDLLVYGIEEPTPGGYGFAWLTLTVTSPVAQKKR